MLFPILLLFGALVTAWPNPEPINGTIPFNTHSTLDPSLMRRKTDGKLFLFNSGSDEIWTSDSLHGPWTKFVNSTGISLSAGGPSVFDLGDQYVMYSSYQFNYSTVGVTNPAAQSGSHMGRTMVRTSKTLEPNDWTEIGPLEIPWSANYNVIDQSYLRTDDGQNLLSFGSYQHGIFQIPLADSALTLAKGANQSITHLAMNNSYTPTHAYDPTEASFQFKWGDFYYLFFSSGECCRYIGTGGSVQNTWPAAGEVYKIMACRSKNPRTGYVDKEGNSCATKSGGTLVLPSHDLIWAPGGQGVVNDTEAGGPILFYHYAPINETTTEVKNVYYWGYNKLDFSTGWPVAVK